MSGSIAPSRYTNALRYNPFRLATGRYPGRTAAEDAEGAIVPPMPVVETPQQVPPPIAPPPVVDIAAPAPGPAAPPPVYIGAQPVEWEQYGGEGSGAGSGSAGDALGSNFGGIGDNSLGGMPGPSPDQSISGLLGALATGAGFALGPVGTLAGVLTGIVNDVERGQTVGTSRSLTDVMAQVLGLTPPSQVIAGLLGDDGLPGDISGINVGVTGADPAADAAAAGGNVGDAISESTPGAPATGTPGGQFGGLAGGQEYGGQFGGGSGPGGLSGNQGLGLGLSDDTDPSGLGGLIGDLGGYSGFGGGVESDALGEGQAGNTGDADGEQAGMYKSGGYTGHGRDGRLQPDAPAGTVHEGEVVLNADATRRYGPNILLALNARKVPANALRALVKRYA